MRQIFIKGHRNFLCSVGVELGGAYWCKLLSQGKREKLKGGKQAAACVKQTYMRWSGYWTVIAPIFFPGFFLWERFLQSTTVCVYTPTCESHGKYIPSFHQSYHYSLFHTLLPNFLLSCHFHPITSHTHSSLQTSITTLSKNKQGDCMCVITLLIS